jgi:hypothetical protein
MDVDVIITISCGAAAIVALYLIAARMIGGCLMPALVVAPLAGMIPWAKPYPAIGDALTLFASTAILGIWLYTQGDGPKRLTRGAVAALVVIAVKPEMLPLALAAVIVEGWRRRALWKQETISLVAAAIAVASLAIIVLNPVPPALAVEGLGERILNGAAWTGENWTLRGAGIQTSMKSAMSFGATFYIPLLVPFAAMALKYRREWWFAPLVAWCAIVVALSIWPGRLPILRANPPMAAALFLACGVPGALRLRDEFARRKLSFAAPRPK